MTETEPPQFSIAELGAKFGEHLGQMYGQIITLEKQLNRNLLSIQAMTKNEARLIDHLEDLQDELALLKESNPLSPELSLIADEAKAIIDEKAAPEDG